ncbi:hypothetical protein AB3X21_03785 [Roseomonas mucosa]
MILAEDLKEAELRSALAEGNLRAALDSSTRGPAVTERLYRLVFRRCAEIGTRAEQRLKHH